MATIPDDKVVVSFWSWPGSMSFPSRELSVWIPDRVTLDRLAQGIPCPGSDNLADLFRWLAAEVDRGGAAVVAVGTPEPVRIVEPR